MYQEVLQYLSKSEVEFFSLGLR